MNFRPYKVSPKSYLKEYSPKSDLCQDIFRITEFQCDYLYEINVLWEKMYTKKYVFLLSYSCQMW